MLEGRPGQRAYILGQAPGIVEGVERRPWRGRAGQTLRRWLELDEAAFYETFYCASVTRCDPGRAASGRGDRTPTTDEQELCAFWRRLGARPAAPVADPDGGRAGAPAPPRADEPDRRGRHGRRLRRRDGRAAAAPVRCQRMAERSRRTASGSRSRSTSLRGELARLTRDDPDAGDSQARPAVPAVSDPVMASGPPTSTPRDSSLPAKSARVCHGFVPISRGMRRVACVRERTVSPDLRPPARLPAPVPGLADRLDGARDRLARRRNRGARRDRAP